MRAAARADYDADLALGFHVHSGEVHARVVQGFGSRGDSQRNHASDVLALFSVDPFGFVEVVDLAGDLHRQVARVKTGDAFDAAFSRKNGAAKRFIADAVRAYTAHSSDDDSLGHESPIVS